MKDIRESYKVTKQTVEELLMQMKTFSSGARLCAILHDRFSALSQNLFLPAKSKLNVP